MTPNTPVSTRVLGTILYFAGALIGLALLVFSVWGDIEASTFGVAQQSDERLASLRCPVFIAKDEVGVITASINNPTDRELNPIMRSRITEGYVTFSREADQKVTLAPGETAVLEWEFTSEDAAYERLVLARFFQLRHFTLPSRMGTCGILILPISGITGQSVWIASFAASLILTAISLRLLTPGDRTEYNRANEGGRRARTKIKSLVFLNSYILIATLVSLVGNWLLSGGLIIFAAVAVIGVLSYVLISN
jgi:hypothetical protein